MKQGDMRRENKERRGEMRRGDTTEWGGDGLRSSIFLPDPALLVRGWSGKPNSRAWIGRLSSGRAKQSLLTDTIKFRAGRLQAVGAKPDHYISSLRCAPAQGVTTQEELRDLSRCVLFFLNCRCKFLFKFNNTFTHRSRND